MVFILISNFHNTRNTSRSARMNNYLTIVVIIIFSDHPFKKTPKDCE